MSALILAAQQALQQALEALEAGPDVDPIFAGETEDALRAALAEPTCKSSLQVEPVAWRTFDGEGGYDYCNYENNENYRDEYIKRNGPKYASWVEPLYTAPPSKPLTD